MEQAEFVGPNAIVSRAGLVRLIGETLHTLGYAETRTCLETESGVALYSRETDSFMRQIARGEWRDSVEMLPRIGILDQAKISRASLLIYEQKYYELLSEGRKEEAVCCLRQDISPYATHERREKLAWHLGEDVVQAESREKLLEKLQALLSPAMIPKNRLIDLIEKALDLQASTCKFHNSSNGELLFFPDHHCGGPHNIPLRTSLTLTEHEAEVRCLQFSHDGRYLASSSDDSIVIVWEVQGANRVLLREKLVGHQGRILCIAWSPDDTQLLTCGLEEVVRRWNAETGASLDIYEDRTVGMVSCAWSEDGQHIFTGATDRSVRMWDLEGKEVKRWEGVTDATEGLGVTRDNLISICKQKKILLSDLQSPSLKKIKEKRSILSFSLSQNKQLLLVSLRNKRVSLWNIAGDPRLMGVYKGSKGGLHHLKCCFGGRGEAFIASGSNDSKVYIWNRFSGDLICELQGHSQAVNSVSWNPTNPHMLASASSDKTIRIWGLEEN